MLLTAPLTAIFYAGHALAGLPFVPFTIFDWTTRILPGKFVTSAIECMVRIIRWFNLGATSTTAKTAEQAMAISGFLVAGILCGVILFALLRGHDRRSTLAIGLLAGGLAGIAAALIDRSIAFTPVNRFRDAVWIVVLFLLWGTAFVWCHRRLITRVSGATGIGNHPTSVEILDRRRFAIQLAGVAAVITVVGAAIGKTVRRHEELAITKGDFWSASHPLPNADAPIVSAPGTRPELTPVPNHYRIDINAVPPVLIEESWRLKIRGLVAQPLTFTLDELRHFESSHQFITLSCISNLVGGDLIGTTRWTGVSLKRLLPQLRLLPSDAFKSQLGRRLLRSGRHREHQRGRSIHAGICMGRRSAERRARVSTTHLYSRPLWDETAEMD